MTTEVDLLLVQIKDGVSIWVPSNLNDLATYIFLEQEDWFEPEVDFVRRYLKPGMRVIDIGAAFGAFSLPMARAVGPEGRVWSYEPASHTSGALRRSAAQNKFAWQEIVQAAVSNVEGEATLSLFRNAELNRLSSHDGKIEQFSQATDTEVVSVVTLDKEAESRDFGLIDFVKIDAEGEEGNILRGGESLFLDSSMARPVILMEVDAGSGEVNWQLVDDMERMGFAAYRLAHGPKVMIPIDRETHTFKLLNLFFCPPERVDELEHRGLLVRSIPPVPSVAGQWVSYAANQGWYQLQASVMQNFAGFPKDAEERLYLAVLDLYAAYASEQSGLSLPERMSALRESTRLLVALCHGTPTLPRCLSLGGIGMELGEGNWSKNALNDAVQQLTDTSNPVVIDEPFVLPSSRIASMAPDVQIIPADSHATALLELAVAAAIESYEMNRHLSSYFTNADTLPDLRLLQSLPYRSAAIERRLLMKAAQQLSDIAPSDYFADTSEPNLNPEFWRSE